MSLAETGQRDAVGIIGFGRFGRSLGRMFSEAGIRVVAFDPIADVDEEFAAGDLYAVPRRARTLILAVPVAETRPALDALRPHLAPDHVVLDVGSVKVGPERAMREILAEEIPWVATHPLFGPTSLARGERPLRVVICPNPLHPGAVESARSLYARAGCVVIERDAERHDREMAEGHAVAYFVAKGLLDAGLSFDSPLAPPSAQAIAQTVDAVRSDAGHLFSALQRENPFAADVRSRLLEALGRVDSQLARPAPVRDDGDAAPAAESIPDLDRPAPELVEVRDLIDELDQSLVALLARRALLAERASSVKSELGRGVRDQGREDELRSRRRAWACEQGLDPEDIDEIFRSVLEFSRRLQFRKRTEQ